MVTAIHSRGDFSKAYLETQIKTDKIIKGILHFKGFWNCEAKCGITIDLYNNIVIMTELPDNNGTSVTNLSEEIASYIHNTYLKDELHGSIIWIEHYPTNRWRDQDQFDTVNYTYNYIERLHIYSTPQWKPVKNDNLRKTLIQLLQT
jgi:hypothetical protein